MSFLVIIALLFASSAQSRELKLLPPEEFDHPFDGIVTIQAVRDQDEAREMCPGMAFNLGIALGCSRRVFTKQCLIVKVPDAEIIAMGHDPAIFMRHEIGHCNGWPSTHKGAR